MLLSLDTLARHVEEREWPATLDRWKPWPGYRPPALAVAEVRRRHILLMLALIAAGPLIVAAAVGLALALGYLVDPTGAVATVVEALVIVSAVGAAAALAVRRWPLNAEYRESLRMTEEFASTVAVSMSALDLDIHAAVLDSADSLQETVDGFLLAQGMEIAKHEIAERVIPGFHAKTLVTRDHQIAKRRLDNYIEKFGNLLLLHENAKAEAYTARGRQALASAGRPAGVPVPDAGTAAGGSAG